MGRIIKKKPLPLAIQLNDIKNRYKNIIVESGIKSNCLTLVLKLKPSTESVDYKIKIVYKKGESPKAWILDPPIESVNGKYPHHIYSFDKMNHPRICVYYPNGSEWAGTMLLSKTFIPWILTWLNTYEYWVLTGRWNYDEIIGKKQIKS